jgi:hypothetical protein
VCVGVGVLIGRGVCVGVGVGVLIGRGVCVGVGVGVLVGRGVCVGVGVGVLVGRGVCVGIGVLVGRGVWVGVGVGVAVTCEEESPADSTRGRKRRLSSVDGCWVTAGSANTPTMTSKTAMAEVRQRIDLLSCGD